jgi:CheY-like chemotaxis protein
LTAMGDREDDPPLERPRHLAAPVHMDRETDPGEAGNAYPPNERSSLRDPLMRMLGEMNAKLDTAVGQGRSHGEVLEKLCREMGEAKTHASALALEIGLLVEKPQPNGLSDMRVLLVEDEDHLLDVMERTLSAHGCKVVTTCSREAAEAVLNSARGRREFNIAIVDVHIPRSRDGLDLCHRITAYHPSTALVVMSAKDLSEIPGLDQVPAVRLQKIFTPQDFTRAVYAAIGHADPAADTERPPVPPPSLRDFDVDEPDTATETPEAKAKSDAPGAPSPP